MAIVWVREISGAREHMLDNVAKTKSYTRAFKVLSDTAAESITAVRSAPGVPLFGDNHPDDFLAGLARKQVKNIRNEEHARKLWVVTCFYEPRDNDAPERHPLDRPWEIDYNGETFQTIAEFDKFGTGAMNSAGQYFDPPLQVDNTRGVLTVTRNEPWPNTLVIQDYQEAINSDLFLGGAPYTVKLKRVRTRRVIEPWTPPGQDDPILVVYWPHTYEFHYWYKTWWLFPLDQGRYELESGGSELVSIKDVDDTPVVDPVPLDGAGHQVPPSSLPGGAVFMTYRYYRELPFAPLGFL